MPVLVSLLVPPDTLHTTNPVAARRLPLPCTTSVDGAHPPATCHCCPPPPPLPNSTGSAAEQAVSHPQPRGAGPPLPRHLHARERPADGGEGFRRGPKRGVLSGVREEGLEQGFVGIAACLVR